MAPEIVGITEEDLPELHRVCSTTFGEESKPEMVADERLVCEYDRMIGVSDEGQLVASAGAYSFRLTVPGLSTVGAAGVTWVGVLPTHRRQGILRQMMAYQLDDVAEREEPVAVLTASEAVIYGRFGYGVGAQHVKASVETRRAALVDGARAPGTMRLAWSGDEEAIAAMADVYDAWRMTRPGALSRHEGWWEIVQRDKEYRRDGRTPAFYVIHETADGEPDGYAIYRVKGGEDDDDNEAYVVEVVTTDPHVDAALWRFLLDLDLTKRVVAQGIPVDDPLKWRLADPRALTVEWLEDWLWVRILDVPAALEARAYDAPGRLLLRVYDRFRPDGRAAGTFRLDASPGGASCERADGAEPDVTVTVEALASAWLGAAPLTTLALAGRATGDADMLRKADAMFASHPLPFCNHPF
jgi:predicted acetyltransferase